MGSGSRVLAMRLAALGLVIAACVVVATTPFGERAWVPIGAILAAFVLVTGAFAALGKGLAPLTERIRKGSPWLGQIPGTEERFFLASLGGTPQLGASANPSKFLVEKYGVVPFSGRTDYLGRLAAWRDGDEDRAVWLVTGPGGSGKSRLAREFGFLTQEAGWTVLVTSATGPHSSAISDLGRISHRRPVLVIVDYAERMRRDVRNALRDHIATCPAKTRVLFLARAISDWSSEALMWERLEAEVYTERLPPLEEGAKQEILEVALRSFGKRLHVEPRPSDASIDLHSAKTTLGLLILVLNEVLGRRDQARGVGEHDADETVLAFNDPVKRLLVREQSYWGLSGERLDVMRNLVLVASLTGEVGVGVGRRLLEDLKIDYGDDELRKHREYYPPQQHGELAPLLPDFLAEEFVAACLDPKPPLGLGLAPDEARNTVARLLEDRVVRHCATAGERDGSSVALVVGIACALMASIDGDLTTYIAPTRDGAVAIRTTTGGKSGAGKSTAEKSSTGKSKVGATATK